MYSQPAVDKVIDDASAALDVDKATPLWRKANELIVADLPAIPIERMVEIAVMRSDVAGYAFRPWETGRRIDFYRLSRAPRR